MKNMPYRLLIIVMLFSLFIAVPTFTHGGEVHDADVAKVMDVIKIDIQHAMDALKTEDYFTTATHLMSVARAFKVLEDAELTKGSKEEWDAMHEKVINEAFKAIGACANQNNEQIEVHIAEMFKFMVQGHEIFK